MAPRGLIETVETTAKKGMEGKSGLKLWVVQHGVCGSATGSHR
jgi:hypothetical protein